MDYQISEHTVPRTAYNNYKLTIQSLNIVSITYD